MILYLHGFTSGPQSHKAQALGARMGERGLGDRFLSPQLPASPREAIALADELIARHGVTTVVGSSLGGYYTTYLAETHDLKGVLVNPAVVAHLSLRNYIGPQRWLYTGETFEFRLEHIEELRAIAVPVLSKPERFWLLVEEGDETLDYRHAVARYAGARQTVLPGGDHSFTRWNDYLDEIIAYAGLG
ncbi:MAG: YqiA/YcfP family alpha/beta fold hydrolase [Sulfuritalea sp.]|nr:YqiA/YcfP family alpha/beta fold hydrolase [Sulfuritalea sp.]MDP1984204.1 YqiA/YcfP family alpha/beta fold hydrolase [Sulfuritalea sp.]